MLISRGWSAAAVVLCQVMVTTAIRLPIPVTKPTPVEFRLADVYGANMVLQMSPKSAHIWGWGKPFSEIVLDFNGNSISSTVGQDGRWSVRLPPQPAGGPHIITVHHIPIALECAAESVELNGVMFGDVWVCSGGSNMAQELNTISGAKQQVERALKHTTLRLFQTSRQASASPQLESGVVREWETTEQEVLLSYFPALCLLYGMNMADLHGDRPIGVIEAAWGGTPIEAWVSERTAAHCGTPSTSGSNQYSNHALWNGMIQPLTRLAVRGAIWHQGEANTAYNNALYACHFRHLLDDWRRSFVDGTVSVIEENGVAFPFGFVQLGPSRSARHEDWSSLRLQQDGGLDGVFMASSYDLVDPPELNVTGLGAHYRDKVTAAARLADAAKALLYVDRKPTEGSSIVNFSQAIEAMYDVRRAITVLDIIVDDKNNQVNLIFNTNVRLHGEEGLYFVLLNGTAVPARVLSSSGREVALRLEPEADFVVNAWGAAPCSHRNCAVYSDDALELPAHAFKYKLLSTECRRPRCDS